MATPRKENPKQRGRPTDYRPEFKEQVYKFALLGMTDVELAEQFDVSESTLNTWKQKHRDFLESLRAGKKEADAKVTASLYERAMGYSHPEDKFFQHEGKVITVKTIKQYPPDSTAMIFWLKNRHPEKWRDKHDVNHSGAVGSFVLKTAEAESGL